MIAYADEKCFLTVATAIGNFGGDMGGGTADMDLESSGRLGGWPWVKQTAPAAAATDLHSANEFHHRVWSTSNPQLLLKIESQGTDQRAAKLDPMDANAVLGTGNVAARYEFVREDS